jgi:predicted DNA-binding ribbon-helix-helix protein
LRGYVRDAELSITLGRGYSSGRQSIRGYRSLPLTDCRLLCGAGALLFTDYPSNPLTCVIFATLETFFAAATVCVEFYCFDVTNLQQEILGAVMKSLVVKRSVVVAGHKTSVSLEDAFWKSLKEIAGYRHMKLSALVAAIDSERHDGNLSSVIRLFVFKFYRDQLDLRDRCEGTPMMIGRDPAPQNMSEFKKVSLS